MVYSRLPMKDPRTVARDIPGIFDIIFPQLSSGAVAYFNKNSVASTDLQGIQDEDVKKSNLKRAMLFEIANVRGEQILNGHKVANWDECLQIATERQSRHYNVTIPEALTVSDIFVAEGVGQNLVLMLNEINIENLEPGIVYSPEIYGYQWITSSVGDFAVSDKLIEVKCTSRNFGSADYRQVLMYWLLSYAAALSHDKQEWKTVALINPRLNHKVELSFDEIIRVTSAGKTKVQILELFSSIVGDYALKSLPEFRL